MKNYWELEPTKVQVDVKDEKHLDELFKMCELFGLKIHKDKYENSDDWFRMSSVKPWFSNYFFDVDYTEVTTEQFYEILSHNYGYQGDIKGFDKEVVLRMLEYQTEQRDRRDIKVFEENRHDGFLWDDTTEGSDFWDDTIGVNEGKFPKQQTTTEASQDLEKNYEKLYNDLLEKFNQLKKIINK